VYKIYFWVSYCRPWFLWPETKKLVIPFLRIYLFASLLSEHCVSPHRRSHKPRRISTVKTIYHLLWLPPWPQPIVENGSSIQGRSQDDANIEEFKYLSKKKIFPVPTLFIASLLEDEQRLSMGEEVGTMQFLEFKGEQLKKFKGVQIKKSKLRCESLVTECMTKKWMNEKKNERKKERREKKNDKRVESSWAIHKMI
jgi:hypothetical protein